MFNHFTKPFQRLRDSILPRTSSVNTAEYQSESKDEAVDLGEVFSELILCIKNILNQALKACSYQDCTPGPSWPWCKWKLLIGRRILWCNIRVGRHKITLKIGRHLAGEKPKDRKQVLWSSQQLQQIQNFGKLLLHSCSNACIHDLVWLLLRRLQLYLVVCIRIRTYLRFSKIWQMMLMGDLQMS